MHQDEEDDHPGGGDGEGEGSDKLAHGCDFPVGDRRGKCAHRVVAAGIRLRRGAARHRQAAGGQPERAGGWSGKGVGQRIGLVLTAGADAERSRSERLTNGPATTRRIAISHSDHLRE